MTLAPHIDRRVRKVAICKVCDGKGKCNDCRGWGYHTGLGGRMTCTTCRGSGKCTTCKGRG